MQRTSFILIFFFLIFLSVIPENGCSAQTTTVEKREKITQKDLDQVLERNRTYTTQGKVADYIPELSKANRNDIAIAVVTENGKILSSGDIHQTFTIQSISKLVALMLAVEDHGEQYVFKNMGYYGTHQPFNHYANLEKEGKPLNPMMNAGAILTTSMIKGNGTIPYERILERIRYITKNNNIQISEAVYQSEKATGNRNRGIFYLLKSWDLITGSEEQLDTYFRQCSILIDAVDLAKIGYYFAHNCIRFDGDSTYKNPDLATLIQSQMLIAGMYDFSGEYARTVGLPSKSGVGGGICVSIPGKMGIGSYSPALDSHGNSVAGYQMILELTKKFNWNIFNANFYQKP